MTGLFLIGGLALATCCAALSATISQRVFSYDGWQCSYRHKKPASSSTAVPPVLLIHPIGIGMSSWFWEPLMAALEDHEVFAPDLLGCGASEAWDPSERGLFIPLDYVRQAEELWRQEIGRPCVVVTQGGLAPVGVSLATRATDTWDGARAVSHLVMCSPPTWRDMAAGTPRDAVVRNYDLWTGPLGRGGYGVLRRRRFVQFFSNSFLFAGKPDDVWLERCCDEALEPAKEHPVFAFNAGVVGARGLYDELVSLSQPTLLCEGAKDGRVKQRDAYVENVRDCGRVRIADSLNVLPWETPLATANAITSFVLPAAAVAARLHAKP